MHRLATDSEEVTLRKPLKFSIDDDENDEESSQLPNPVTTKRIFKHIRDTHRPPSYAHILINRFLFRYFPRLLLLLFIIIFIIALLPGGWRVALCAADFLPAPSLPSGQNITLIGHRGSEFPYPENSLHALKKGAKDVGFVEFDISLTKDDDIIVMHDETLDRTTNGTGITCRRSSAYTNSLVLNIPETDPQGRALTGSQCTDTMSSGQIMPCIYRVPTLEQVFDALPSDTKMMIDIKECYAPGVAVTTPLCTNCTLLMERTKRLMQQYFVKPERLIFTSTEKTSLKVFYDGIPKGSSFALSMGKSFSHYKQKTFLQAMRGGPWDSIAMSVGLGAVRPDFVKLARKSKVESSNDYIKIYGWTIRKNLDLRLARCAGMSNLIVAEPSRILKLLSWNIGSFIFEEP